jgi:hypothetical protein
MQQRGISAGTQVADDIGMQTPLVLMVLALFGVLVSSVWMRRADLQYTGEVRTMIPALALCLISVLLILSAAS